MGSAQAASQSEALAALLRAQDYNAVDAALTEMAKNGSMDPAYNAGVDPHLNALLDSGKISHPQLQEIGDTINRSPRAWGAVWGSNSAMGNP